jgi:hypothetical protein
MTEEIKKEDKELKPDTQTQISDTTKKSEDKQVIDDKSKTAADTQTIPREQFESVSKNLSEKDKQISQLKKDMERMQNSVAVKDMLIESDLPEVIKSKIKANIDNITPDTFESKTKEYLEIYEQGRESFKNDQASRINKTPTQQVDLGVREKLESAKTLDDLEEVYKNLV